MITLLTPTRNRPLAFALLERWISRQTYRGSLQWIVVNDGIELYEYYCGQEVMVRPAQPGESHSLCENLLYAFPAIRGDLIVVAEDDDWLAPRYLERLAHVEAGEDLIGSAPAIYYNLATRCWKRMNNHRHSSLGQTAFRRSVIPLLREIASRGRPFMDVCLWREWRGSKKILSNFPPFHVSMKSLPGERGIGIGHRMKGKPDDSCLSALRRLIGTDADEYMKLAQHLTPPVDLVKDGAGLIDSGFCAPQS